MTVCNLVCGVALVAMCGVLGMLFAFWCGVAVGRRRGARTLVCGGAQVSADVCPRGCAEFWVGGRRL